MSETHAEYIVKGRTTIRQGCLVPFADTRYVAPTPDDIKQALREGSLTGAAAGQLLGVTGRTIRKWTGGERDIPYSAWRLLLISIGLAVESQRDTAAE